MLSPCPLSTRLSPFPPTPTPLGSLIHAHNHPLQIDRGSGYPLLGFFALRNIAAGEELTWNYDNSVPHLPCNRFLFVCLCFSSFLCRKWTCQHSVSLVNRPLFRTSRVASRLLAISLWPLLSSRAVPKRARATSLASAAQIIAAVTSERNWVSKLSKFYVSLGLAVSFPAKCEQSTRRKRGVVAERTGPGCSDLRPTPLALRPSSWLSPSTPPKCGASEYG